MDVVPVSGSNLVGRVVNSRAVPCQLQVELVGFCIEIVCAEPSEPNRRIEPLFDRRKAPRTESCRRRTESGEEGASMHDGRLRFGVMRLLDCIPDSQLGRVSTHIYPESERYQISEIRVPKGERPSYGKYVAYAVIGIFLVTRVVGTAARGVDSTVLGVVVLLIAGVLNVGVVFLMVQSLIEKWFDAAAIIEE
jgi:hypothetical protein